MTASDQPPSFTGEDHPSLRGPVALVSAVAPFPSDAGKKVVLAGLLDYLIARVGADRVHYVHVSPSSAEPVAMPVQVHRVTAPRHPEQVVSLLRRTLLTGRHSLQESMLYAPRVRRAIQEALAGIGAQLEIFDTIRMGQYAEEIPARPDQRRVLYLDDLFSVRYTRMLETLRTHSDLDVAPLGEFRHVMPGIASRVADQRSIQRGLLMVERRLVARREREVVTGFESSLLVSPEECARLSGEVGASKVRTLPPVVDPKVTPRDYQGPPVFLLLGLLSLPHNHDAVMTFLRDCMPQVRHLLPDAEVHIVGRGVTPEIREAASAYPEHVVVAGFVPDLKELMSRSCAVLVPLRFGSGVKIKVLEAIAHGVPVLSTPVGAEGIAAGDEQGIVVESEIARFPQAMAKLARPAYNSVLSERALRHHAATYSRDAAFQKYDEIFGVLT